MKKLIESIRKMFSRVRIDVKDHILGTFLYMFMVVMPVNLYNSNFGLIAIGVGLAIAVLWEVVQFKKNIEDSLGDVLIYIIVMLPYTLEII